MSLIVDINPVPWEILDLVRARILKNRAKKQKRQPGELRRVMQANNGILAKQRWEEPSFIGDNDVPFIIIYKKIEKKYNYINDNFTIKLNGATLGNVNFPLEDNYIMYFFIWSADTIDHENTIKRWLNTIFYLNGLPFVLNPELGQANVIRYSVIGFSFDVIVIVLEDNLPKRGDAAKIEMKNIQSNGSSTNRTNSGYIHLDFVDQGLTSRFPFPIDVSSNVKIPSFSGYPGQDITIDTTFPL
jgi:hypothetical protein